MQSMKPKNFNKNLLMPEVEAKQQLKAGNLIYVNSYIRSDGTEVKGYYRSRPNI